MMWTREEVLRRIRVALPAERRRGRPGTRRDAELRARVRASRIGRGGVSAVAGGAAEARGGVDVAGPEEARRLPCRTVKVAMTDQAGLVSGRDRDSERRGNRGRPGGEDRDEQSAAPHGDWLSNRHARVSEVTRRRRREPFARPRPV